MRQLPLNVKAVNVLDYSPAADIGAALVKSAAALPAGGGIIYVPAAASPYKATTTATIQVANNQTIKINALSFTGGGQSGPQRKTIRAQQAASGGPYTLGWPSTGTPTISSPTVKWAAGAAPVMSIGANAVDLYDLTTFDGATWYGRALQNVS